jgi:hypothetical protein
MFSDISSPNTFSRRSSSISAFYELGLDPTFAKAA